MAPGSPDPGAICVLRSGARQIRVGQLDVIVYVDRVFQPRPSSWYQLEVGGWWGLGEFTVRSRNGRLQQLVPAAALSPQHR